MPQNEAGKGVTLTVCNSCRRRNTRDAEGAEFAELLRYEARTGASAVAIEGISCLSACTRACAVQLSTPGKSGYVLADFQPRIDCARAILDFTQLYAQSASGIVPTHLWPNAVKGRFAIRIPAENAPKAKR